MDDAQAQGNHLGNLGIADKELGEKEKACELWREALSIFDEINSPAAERVRGRMEKAGC
jgi:hypothetical protein